MQGRESVKRIIRGEELRPVPRGEFFLNRALCQELTGNNGSGVLEAGIDLLGFDFYGLLPQYPEKQFIKYDDKGRKELRDCWGRIFWQIPGGREQLVAYPVVDLQDIKQYRFPDLAGISFPDSGTLRNKGLFLFGIVDGVFQAVARTMDLLDFLAVLEEEPDLLEPMFARAVEFSYGLAELLCRTGVDAILVTDDVAHRRGLFCNREVFFRWVAPYEQELFAAIDKLGKPVFFHSDGNIMSLLEWLAGTPVCGLHSLEPLAGMNLPYIKLQYGKRFILMGGIDLSELYEASEQQVKKLVAERVALLSQGGGYLLSSASGFLTEDIDAATLKAMYYFDR